MRVMSFGNRVSDYGFISYESFYQHSMSSELAMSARCVATSSDEHTRQGIAMSHSMSSDE